MKIAITGANGYIGSHVAGELSKKGHQVIACDINFDKIDENIEKCIIDIFQDDPNIFKTLKEPDVLLHMAWRDGFAHNSKKHIGDLSGHYKFLTNMIDGGLKHLAVMGSMHEVGYWEGAIDENTPCNPLSMYGIAKDTLRKVMIAYCENNNCNLQWLRGYYIFGDDKQNHSIFTKLLEAAQDGKKTFPFTTGKNKYDFVSVKELANQISATVTQNEINGIINCCSGNPISLAEKVETYIKDNKLDIQLEYGKFPDRAYDSPVVYGDPSKINNILNNQK